MTPRLYRYFAKLNRITIEDMKYLAETIFNPFTGRNPLGSIKVYDTIEQANTDQKRHPKMIIAGYNTSLNHIYRI